MDSSRQACDVDTCMIPKLLGGHRIGHNHGLLQHLLSIPTYECVSQQCPVGKWGKERDQGWVGNIL